MHQKHVTTRWRGYCLQYLTDFDDSFRLRCRVTPNHVMIQKPDTQMRLMKQLQVGNFYIKMDIDYKPKIDRNTNCDIVSELNDKLSAREMGSVDDDALYFVVSCVKLRFGLGEHDISST
ncbi:hypothetical protein RND71_018936 [Anisodus tanguticus]|uniref:Uncharacterized protein n=1 Tax=Anisodus tanguticus TaxID=243964 RepID=A0AAE1S5I6_9SOLA|nr:hypothetical protein RND71_018936 [Anisodus tanguticus]